MPLSITPGSALSPQAVGDRVTTLAQAGHAWMPADMKLTLASSPTSDTHMVSIADSIKQTLANTWDGFTEAFDDPVLHKEPSTALALSRLLHASLGPIPVAQPDLTAIQSSLQKAGFGQGLSSNGVWGADWNDAYNSYREHVIGRQLAGDESGSITTQSAAHHWYDDFKPSNAIDAVIGYAKSLPGDARDLAANIVGSAVNTLAGNETKSSEGVNSVGARTAEGIESFFGNKHAHQKIVEEIAHPDASLLQDVGTVLALVPIIGQGTRIAAVARGEFAVGASAEAAERTGGVIAKSLGGLSERDAAAGEARRGLLTTRAFTNNIPLLGKVGPAVGRLADDDGLYYNLRTHLAAPYKYPAVRVAGDIAQRTMLTGAALRGGAQLSQAIAGPNDLTNDIQNTKATDLVDRNLDRIIGTPFEHPFSDTVNLLGFVLHGPLGSTQTSAGIGNNVQHATDTVSAALGRVGLHGIYQRAVQTAYGGKLRDIDDLASEFGGEENLDRFIISKTADHAASHYAQKTAQREGLSYGTDAAAYRQRVGELADEIWADPTQHIGAIRELIADSGGTALINRFADDMRKSGMDAREYVSDGVKWMQAGGHLATTVRNGDARYLFGGQGQAVIHDAQDDFDHGLGQDNPLPPKGASTRRAYVREVGQITGRVRNGVKAARLQAVKNISSAQDALDDAKTALGSLGVEDDGYAEAQLAARKAQGQFQAAKAQQAKLEDAFASNLTYQVENTLKGLASARSGVEAEWSRVAADVRRLHTLIRPGLGDGEQFTLTGLLDTPVDADSLYTKMNGAPVASDTAIGSGDWMREHLPHADGVLGLARVTTKSYQDATADLNRFEQQLAAADPAEAQQVLEAMKNYGAEQYGMDERSLGVFDGNPDKLLATLRERGQANLASDVFLTPDAPQSVRDAVQRMADLGYKPMLGSHIGHMWDSSLPPFEDVAGAVTRRRRMVGVLGLDPTQVTSRVAGQNARIRVLTEMQKVADEPKAHFPARTTAETIIAVLTDKKLIKPEMRLPERLAYYGSYPLHKPAIRQLESQGMTAAEAGEAHKEELLRALQIRDIPRKEFMHALTTPGEFENGAMWAGVDKTTAALLYRAALRGYAQRPNYIMGLSGIEDWGRAGFTILDKAAHAFPDSGAFQAFANSPNALIQLRNRARFTLSPFFDFRRVTKTNYKMGLDGVLPTTNPMGYLEDHGIFTKAHTLLSKIHGDTSTAGYDDADRYLHQQSIFGVYNSRHYEAYYAWQKHLDGASDDEIRAGLTKVFDYGSARGKGRSALERTVNTVFFPFSFEKTLLRNTGMYLLDHPQQALLLTGAMDAYGKANSHDAISQWTQDHLPVLRDLQQLNAFAHGISPGELGGINAPLVNLFLPQVWNGKDFTKANLKKALPIWSNFSNLMSDLHQQEIVAHNTVQNGLSYAIHLGAPRKPLDPYLPMETVQAQRRDAQRLRNKAIFAFTDALDYNAHQGDDSTKIRFGDQPQLPPGVQGQVVSRTSIGQLVKRWFPAYDPQFGQKYAIEQEAKANAQIAQITAKDPARGQSFSVFAKLANQVAGHLERGDYDTVTAAETIAQFRQAAVAGSETDPDFYAFYRAHYQWLTGPLEEVTK